jgi:hypothetical protein
MHNCFSAEVLSKYQAQYEVCNSCGYLRAQEPHWLDEAYTSAIANADTGLVARNIAIANKVVGVLYWVLKETGENHYLDAAGGYGMLTRIMRDFGFDFYWHDPYCTNILALGFEYNSVIGACSVVTAMEVLEHVTDPIGFIEELFTFSNANSLVFTTELYEGEPPKPDTWWYYSFFTGQHIGFFQRRTLTVIAQKLGMYFASANGIHILSKTPINERLLGIVTGRIGSRIAAFWIRKRMNSKMMNDHQLMLKKLVKTRNS